ncbi:MULTISPECIES: FkbM family methyltransferase [unclassified Brevundimonas]|uniref:FkbM family methyltransferase n=1 Tax=unclassified Brevundimonas TaxID=2622653 RepID=UPI003F8FB75F
MFESTEIVRAAFRAILGREPGHAGLAQATTALAHGMPLDDFLSNILHSPEYVSRVRKHSGFAGFTPVSTEIAGRRLWLDLADMYVSRVCLTGSYEPSETEFVRAELREGDTFLDVGANIGWFTTLAAQIVGPSGVVHAFEPRNETRALLARSIVDNAIDDIVQLHDAIVSDRPGQSRLVWLEGGNNPGGTRVMSDVEMFGEGMAIQSARAIAVDDLNIDGRLSLIKMDIEGAEGLALKGARQTLARHRPIILTELYDPALQFVSGMAIGDFGALVKDLGYEVRRLLDGKADEILADVDGLVTDAPISVVLSPF